jgi:5-deoxy-D-glucuronate isomerase
MIEDDFYCTLKLKSGEEIFAKVAASDEDDRTMLLVSNPIIVSEVKGKMGTMGYRVEPWLKTTTDDMFIINMTDVLTMSESSDIEMIVMYQNYIRQSQKESPDNNSKINRRMGYLGNTRDVKEILEKIFKSS